MGCRSRGPSSGVTSSCFPEDARGQGTGANWDRESHKFAFCRDPSGVGQLSGEGRDEGRVGRSGGTDSDLLSAVCQGRACCQALGTPTYPFLPIQLQEALSSDKEKEAWVGDANHLDSLL